MSFRTKKTIFGSLGVVLILICLWLAYQVLDQSVTLDYQSQYAETIRKQRDLLARVLNSAGSIISEASVRGVLAQLPNYTVFEKAHGHIVAEQVSFFFSDGRLVRVDVGQGSDGE